MITKTTNNKTVIISHFFTNGTGNFSINSYNKNTLYTRKNPVNTRRYLDVDSTSFERHGRRMNVKITLCAYWVTFKCNGLKTLTIHPSYKRK